MATGWSYAGMAYTGTACTKGGYNTGAQMIMGERGEDTFATFAHELGHLLNADDSFEEGKYTTGGIMGYSDGTVDGVWQFGRYSKKRLCSYIDTIVNKCDGKFSYAENLGAGPSPSRPAEKGCKSYPSNKKCVFPFKWNGNTYRTCTADGWHSLWCATSVHGDQSVNDYGDCRCCDYKTPSGKCVFPWKKDDIELNTCTDMDHSQLWCATGVNSRKEYTHWDNCNLEC